MNYRLSAVLLSAALLATPVLSLAMGGMSGSDWALKTNMSVTNSVPGFKVLVSAELMCHVVLGNKRKREPFEHNPVMPDDMPVTGSWYDCLLMPAEYYEYNREHKWGNVTIRVKDLQTDDFIVVHLPTIDSEFPMDMSSKVVSFNGHAFHFDLQRFDTIFQSNNEKWHYVDAKLRVHE